MPTNVLPFAVGDEPEARETEPNDALAQANRVAVPAAINGRIQQPGDVDHFLVTAQANQVLDAGRPRPPARFPAWTRSSPC